MRKKLVPKRRGGNLMGSSIESVGFVVVNG